MREQGALCDTFIVPNLHSRGLCSVIPERWVSMQKSNYWYGGGKGRRTMVGWCLSFTKQLAFLVQDEPDTSKERVCNIDVTNYRYFGKSCSEIGN